MSGTARFRSNHFGLVTCKVSSERQEVNFETFKRKPQIFNFKCELKIQAMQVIKSSSVLSAVGLMFLQNLAVRETTTMDLFKKDFKRSINF